MHDPHSYFFLLYLSLFLSWFLSHAMVVGDARWSDGLSLVHCRWLECRPSTAPFTRWPATSPMRAPVIPPAKVRNSSRTRRSISLCRLRATVTQREREPCETRVFVRLRKITFVSEFTSNGNNVNNRIVSQFYVP